MGERTAHGEEGERRDRDFGGYLRRNLGPACRLAALALDDPIAGQEAVHKAAMAAWHIGSEWPDRDLDAAFGREVQREFLRILRTTGETELDGAALQDAPLASALRSISAGDRLALAREFGFAEQSARRAGELARLGAAVTRSGSGPADGADLEARLRAFYAARDPGEEAPLVLRLRLQGSLATAELAAQRRDEAARRAGWGFAVNIPLLMIALTAAIALTSVTNMRAGKQGFAGSTGGPTIPLTITSVAVAQGGVAGSGVTVAASRDSLFTTFQSAPLWHLDIRSCLPDVAGTVDLNAPAQWLGQPVGHVESIAGDPSSNALYTVSLGEYCDPEAHASVDGGRSWASTSLPPGASGGPMWLGFDPANPGTLLAGGSGRLFLSRDAGKTWTSSRELVAPLAFDSTGRLYGWGPGALFESLDDGQTWDRVDAGPATQPAAATAISGGLLLGESDGLWWFPLDGPASLVQPGPVYSLAPAGDGAVILGADSGGHPWLGVYSMDTVGSPFSLSPLPPEVRPLSVTGGQVAANSSGAEVAVAGPSSAICLAAFAR